MIQKLLSFLIFTTILLSPFYIIRWSYFGFLSTTLLETLILATIAVWGISKILRKDFSWPRTSFDKPILFFLLAGIISLFVTPDLRGGLGAFKAYIVEPILFFYILVELNKGVVKSILYGFLFSGLWVSLLGIAQVIFKTGIVTPHEAVAGRAHGVYNTGNALGLYVGPIFALGVGLLALKLKVKSEKLKVRIQNSKFGSDVILSVVKDPVESKYSARILRSLRSLRMTTPFLLFSLFSFLLAILLSKSTGALIGLVAAIATFFILFINQPACAGRQLSINNHLRKLATLSFKIILVIATATGILLFLNISRFTPKVDNPWDRQTSSTLIPRLCLWEGTKNLLSERPIFGAGLSGFKELYSEKYFTCDAEPLEYPHNWVLNFWVEMGILGLAAFLVILWVFFEKVKKVEKEEKIALTAAVVYLLIHGLVDVPYFKNDLALEFWVIIALAEILMQNQSSPCQNQ